MREAWHPLSSQAVKDTSCSGSLATGDDETKRIGLEIDPGYRTSHLMAVSNYGDYRHRSEIVRLLQRMEDRCCAMTGVEGRVASGLAG